MSSITHTTHLFGTLPDGQCVTQYTLCNSNGMTISVMDYGATLTSVTVPANHGIAQELTLGFDSLQNYLIHDAYFGATIGRVANRISNAYFEYKNKTFELSKNIDDMHHLHGGTRGFDKVMWHAEKKVYAEKASINFYYKSLDGDQGYPGTLQVKTSYTLTHANELVIGFEAVTDKTTPIDLTNHAYWNLAGAGMGTILDHCLQIDADEYIELNQDLLATGRIIKVDDTPYDFRVPHTIGERIQATPIKGYDLCFKLHAKSKTQPIASISDPMSGRRMQVATTQPGLQFYTSNSLAKCKISGNKLTGRYGAFCMETQNFPGAVKYSQFPSPFLKPGDLYRHETIFKLFW